MTELSVGIEPVQDLNGYDHPWVGGAGVNIIGDFALAETPSSGGEVSARRQSDGSTYVLSGTASQRRDVYLLPSGSYSRDEGDYYIYAPTGTGINNADPYLYISINDGSSTRYIGTGGSRSSAPFTIASGDVVRGIFVLVASGVNTNGKIVTPMIVKGTTAPTAYAPYSNICPITGHDEVRVFDTAEQMYDPSQVVIGRNWTGGSSDNRAVFEFVPTPNVSYEIVTVGGNFSDVLFIQMNGGAQLSNTGILPSNTPMTITIAENCNRIIIQFNKDSAITTSDFLDFECSVSTKTTTYTTSLGQTVYGGTLDMVTGVLTVDRAMVDLGTLPWVKDSSLNRFYAYLNGAKAPSTNAEVFVGISSAYTAVSLGDISAYRTRDGIMALSTGANLSVRNLALNNLSATDFATAITGQQLVYELATPQTIQLTAQQIKTLVGTNNVWASSGDIVNIKFTYGGLLSELPSDATSVVGKCYCDVEQNGVSSMPFTLNIKKNERES